MNVKLNDKYFEDDEWRQICARVISGHSIEVIVRKENVWDKYWLVAVIDQTIPFGKKWGYQKENDGIAAGGLFPKKFDEKEAISLKQNLDEFILSL